MVYGEELSDEIIRQKNWTEDELRAQGYDYYERKKEVIMARELAAIEAPLMIISSKGEKLTAHAGYMICYRPGDIVRPGREFYDHWPVEPDIFARTYKPWSQKDWQPTPTESHLMSLECQPYYKATGVWAKQLRTDTYVQGLEHQEPVKVRTGTYIAIGVEGEPYSMGSSTLHSRYQQSRKSLVAWLRRLFGG
jgi:hypothetical protein